ncbi:hypothetical protein NEUTE1DRAFT_100972 [Neurospora tetrasperma FGSC 2508]|uniref:Uncharacterized protein n=1 Tax=Neurospora tetrasperma (strain FGSC 2508 / ATCC MYA-4615 / P0657) TaxID=510951 RepID=F8MNC8_NEUT8|nr:uncharacterized protein NEUTE1DRAFT_100972 [Neurospora tetrasperma FGSC 2508]EGO58098.1 hypothetical protein NEUTE1DRAFT_100972 [Neurospora tetrasperma FGSC 2508]
MLPPDCAQTPLELWILNRVGNWRKRELPRRSSQLPSFFPSYTALGCQSGGLATQSSFLICLWIKPAASSHQLDRTMYLPG